MILDYYQILMELLRKLSKKQSWCPLCDNEYGHQEDCFLKEHWDRGLK